MAKTPSLQWDSQQDDRFANVSDYLTDIGISGKYMDNNPDFRLLEKHDPGRAA
jgi:hypothetical protein